eukprot:144478-Rhodomonas_salina.3
MYFDVSHAKVVPRPYLLPHAILELTRSVPCSYCLVLTGSVPCYQVLDLAKAAAACGVEMIVLDDGYSLPLAYRPTRPIRAPQYRRRVGRC